MGIDLRNIARGKRVSLDFRYETEQTKSKGPSLPPFQVPV